MRQSSMNVKVDVRRILNLNGLVKEAKSLFIFLNSMRAETEPILNPSVKFSLWHGKGISKVIL